MDKPFPMPLANRYVLQHLLGKQVGRQTWLAEDLHTQQSVVVKILFLGRDFQWQDLKLFEREAQTLQQLSHPAIPQYLDYLELTSPQRQGFALVQSYVEGKSLETQLRAGRTFSEEDAKQLAKSLLNILVYLHGRSPPIIHRDIKPSNILLANRSGNSVGQMHLVDFGAVQTLVARQGSTITVAGTYGYMPPEQFGGRAVPASDLYSLGATLIFLSTGRHPAELPQQEFRLQFRSLARISAPWADWLTWMTEPSLDRRLSSATAALSVLENLSMKISAKQHSQPKANTIGLPKRPADSDIRLTHTADVLEAIVPPKGFGFGLTALIVFVVFLWLFRMLGFTYLYNSRDVTLLLICGVAIASVAILAVMFMRSVFRKIRLQIDSEKIVLTWELFGRVYWSRSWSCQTFDRIEIILFLSYREETALVLGRGKKAYTFSQNILSPAEMEWLANELGNYLDISVKRTDNRY